MKLSGFLTVGLFPLLAISLPGQVGFTAQNTTNITATASQPGVNPNPAPPEENPAHETGAPPYTTQTPNPANTQAVPPSQTHQTVNHPAQPQGTPPTPQNITVHPANTTYH